MAHTVPTRQHQAEAIDAICAGFDTGKTLIGLRVYEQVAPEMAVVLAPPL